MFHLNPKTAIEYYMKIASRTIGVSMAHFSLSLGYRK